MVLEISNATVLIPNPYNITCCICVICIFCSHSDALVTHPSKQAAPEADNSATWSYRQCLRERKDLHIPLVRLSPTSTTPRRRTRIVDVISARKLSELIPLKTAASIPHDVHVCAANVPLCSVVMGRWPDVFYSEEVFPRRRFGRNGEVDLLHHHQV